MNAFSSRLIRFLGSRRFLWGVMIFFGLEALWFVFSAAYPMAFDEDFHVGIIRIYAGQWSPFLNSQPDGAGAFGALARDPSFLYHYVLSFPYRLFASFTDNQAAQIIVLRLINVGLFTTGLGLFWRVLRRMELSAAAANVCLAVCALVPVVPMLAAHVNYDNLLVLLVAVFFLLAFDVLDDLKRRVINVRRLGGFVVLCLMMAAVKYPALPLIAGAVLFLLYRFVRSFWGNKWPRVRPALKHGFARLSGPARLALLAGALVGLIFCVQRYGVNLYRYHTLVPECHEVLSVEECSAYGPWIRDYTFAQNRQDVDERLLHYLNLWLQGMHHRLFFAVGPAPVYATRLQLPVPAITAKVLIVASTVLLLVFALKIFPGRPYLGFCASVIAVYLSVLWWDGYTQYLYTGQPVAINGRYLVPLLVPMMGLGVWAWSLALARARWLKPLLACATLLLLLHGGGFETYLLRSDSSWYWPNKTIIRLNDDARRALSPVIFEGVPIQDMKP